MQVRQKLTSCEKAVPLHHTLPAVRPAGLLVAQCYCCPSTNKPKTAAQAVEPAQKHESLPALVIQHLQPRLSHTKWSQGPVSPWSEPYEQLGAPAATPIMPPDGLHLPQPYRRDCPSCTALKDRTPLNKCFSYLRKRTENLYKMTKYKPINITTVTGEKNAFHTPHHTWKLI